MRTPRLDPFFLRRLSKAPVGTTTGFADLVVHFD